MNPCTLEEKLRADAIIESFRVMSHKSVQESEEIIRYNTQRIADLKEKARLADIKFAEEMKKHEEMFGFLKHTMRK